MKLLNILMKMIIKIVKNINLKKKINSNNFTIEKINNLIYKLFINKLKICRI